jgi:hypothetical protein
MAVVLVTWSGAGSADETPQLQVTVPPHAVTVGDRVPVQVVAWGGEGAMWGELSVAVTPDGPWAVVDGPRPIRGAEPPAWEVVLAPMEVGELVLPELEVTVRPSDGDPVAAVPTDAVTVSVATVMAPEDEGQPAPLHDPIGVGGLPWESILPWLVVTAPLIALAVWWWRRRSGPASEGVAPALPPFDELQRLVRALGGRVGREPAEGVCDQLATGLRRYLERRSGEPALEMTSHELNGLCRRREWPGEVHRSVHEVMRVADGVRYARSRVAEVELRRVVDRAVEAGQGLETHLSELEAPAAGGER